MNVKVLSCFLEVMFVNRFGRFGGGDVVIVIVVVMCIK